MKGEFASVLKKFELKENDGPNKVVSLTDAIERNVRPGMTLYVEEGSNAAVREIIRQFRDTRPQFTLVMASLSGDALDMVASGLVKKIITPASVEQRPMLGPSHIIQRASLQKNVEIEDWSLYALMLRLMAGALGLSFMPTSSMLGSGMAEANKKDFAEMADPFDSGKQIGLVKALKPDLAIMHCLVADQAGNAILSTPAKACYAGWGARASINGSLLTAEKIVSTDYIRQHAGVVTLPGVVVNSVSETRFGAHPEGLLNKGLSAFKSYAEDHTFMEEQRKARRDPDQLNARIKEWVLDCPTYDAYLKKLGSKKLLFLMDAAGRDTWQKDVEPLLDRISQSPEYNAIEMMTVVAARIVKEKVLKNGHRLLLVGAGTPLAATWLAYLQLRDAGYDVEVVNGSGLYGYMPRPGDPSTTNYHSLVTCKMLGDVMTVYGWLINKCMVVMGGAEIDKWGNINSTFGSNGAHLVGSGGANDAVKAADLMLVVPQSPQRFVEKVSYITVPGANIGTLVSDRGIFEKPSPGEEFILTAYFPRSGTKDEITGHIKEQCGWDLKISPGVKQVPPPTQEELTLLRVLDAGGVLTRPR